MTRDELLLSLLEPSAHIAPGYGIVSFTLHDDRRITVTLIEDRGATVLLATGGGEVQEISREEIRERVDAPSSMPSMRPILSRSELRDVVEYLTTLREPLP
jgi:quinoprotein glucose dehydrogenase